MNKLSKIQNFIKENKKAAIGAGIGVACGLGATMFALGELPKDFIEYGQVAYCAVTTGVLGAAVGNYVDRYLKPKNKDTHENLVN